jgi:hypothetical protein
MGNSMRKRNLRRRNLRRRRRNSHWKTTKNYCWMMRNCCWNGTMILRRVAQQTRAQLDTPAPDSPQKTLPKRSKLYGIS